MKVLTIVGTRPQFVKVAPVSRALRQEHQEVLVHTGQHYSDNMSRVFFEDLGIPAPDYNLEVGSSSHAVQTGKMMAGIEDVLVREKPDCVLVYGDTNTTLAAALATVKLQFPLVHIEAGLRSFNREMPEEINRVITDHVSTVLFAPTQTAVYNLEREGITRNVVLSGDVMCDAVREHRKAAREKSTILERLKLKAGEYLLATIHRSVNTDDKRNLEHIIGALIKSDQRMVFPMHPRTQRFLLEYGLKDRVARAGKLTIINPVGYLDMLMLEMNARKILTDSRGIQQEAYLLKIPCVTLLPETEWVETVNEGWNVLVDADPEKILTAILHFKPQREPADLFGDGQAAGRIVRYLQEWLEKDRTLQF